MNQSIPAAPPTAENATPPEPGVAPVAEPSDFALHYNALAHFFARFGSRGASTQSTPVETMTKGT